MKKLFSVCRNSFPNTPPNKSFADNLPASQIQVGMFFKVIDTVIINAILLIEGNGISPFNILHHAYNININISIIYALLVSFDFASTDGQYSMDAAGK